MGNFQLFDSQLSSEFLLKKNLPYFFYFFRCIAKEIIVFGLNVNGFLSKFDSV